MRYFSADFIFPVSSAPIPNGIVLVDDEGTIQNVFQNKEQIKEDAEIEYHSGIICPGFINAHCHLELSYLKGKISPGHGLAGFIQDLIPERAKATDTETLLAAEKADAEMTSNGIVVVADISNSAISIPVKKRSRIFYHSFIEIFDLHPDKANEVFERGSKLFNEFEKSNLSASIVPHSPYSVSRKLLKLISDEAYRKNSLLSIHNQESAGENEMFLTGKGDFFNELNKISGAFNEWKATGFRSLASTFVHLPKCNKIQFIHNTYSNTEDVRWAHLYNLFVWWCFCPNANLFIENKLPDIDMFRNEVAKITIGTDSYASNNSLSILDELKTIQKFFSKISLQELIRWSTLNGAEFLGLHRKFGSIEKGMKPGLNHIGGIDIDRLELRDISFVKPLI